MKFVLFAIILILLYLLTFKTDIFTVKSIKVVGNDKLTYDQIVNASLCTRGENIFRIDAENGENSLKRLPYIKSATIKRNLPDKIIIETLERKEIAVLNNKDYFVYIDEEGYILSKEEKIEEISLPQIFGIENDNLELGENLFQTIDIGNMEEFIGQSKALDILNIMKYINLSDSDNIMIQLNNNIKVAFGPFDNVKYKLNFLYKILEDIDSKDMKVSQILFNKGENPIIVRDK